MNIARSIDPAVLTPAWRSLNDKLPVRLTTISSEGQYQGMLELMNGLLDIVGDNEEHELADFLDLIGQLVEDFEDRYHPLPDAEPRDVLRFLMEQHGLKQTDLAVEVGGQSVVSEILNGQRGINVRQAKALAARFRVSAGVFV